ncbi:hypothetical protein ABK040_000077 [Willaertia magna]
MKRSKILELSDSDNDEVEEKAEKKTTALKKVKSNDNIKSNNNSTPKKQNNKPSTPSKSSSSKASSTPKMSPSKKTPLKKKEKIELEKETIIKTTPVGGLELAKEAKEKGFEGKHIKDYNFNYFDNISQYEDFVKCVEKRFGDIHNLYIPQKEFERIEEWIRKLEEKKTVIVVQSIKQLDKHGKQYNGVDRDDEDWKKLRDLKHRLQNLLYKHEDYDCNDSSILLELQKVKTNRKKRQEDEKRQSEREFNNLKEAKKNTQMKYFIARDGPKAGYKEYFDWSTTLQLGEVLVQVDKSISSGTQKVKEKHEKKKILDEDDILLSEEII